MITLRVLCEGPTEQYFVTQTLAPHLRPLNVFATGQPLVPGAGGVVPYAKLRKAIKDDVGRSRAHEYVTTMIDLYKLGRYPGNEKRPGESPVDRVTRIENAMLEGLPSPRFIPYIQLHEFEALVLVDPDELPSQFPGNRDAKDAPSKLRKSIGSTPPEDVDDGEQTAPSKRIIDVLPAYKKAKKRAGPIITSTIGIQRLRDACPHFHAWITKLESLARPPTDTPSAD